MVKMVEGERGMREGWGGVLKNMLEFGRKRGEQEKKRSIQRPPKSTVIKNQ